MIGTVAMFGGFPLVWETSKRARELNAGRSLAMAALFVLGLEGLALIVHVVLRLTGFPLPYG